MDELISLLASVIARPIERLYRSRERLSERPGIRITNFNYALLPFGISLFMCGITAVATYSLMHQKAQDLQQAMPWIAVLLMFAFVAFLFGLPRVLWLRIDGKIWKVRLVFSKRYSFDDVRRWGFLWSRSDLRHEPPPVEATFLIEFVDGSTFERIVSPRYANRIAAEMAKTAA